MLDDGEICIKKFQGGNASAFKKIYNYFYLPIKSYAYQYIPQDEVIEDFVQDAFLQLWEKRQNFSFIAGVKSFLYTATKNKCLDYIRHQKAATRYISILSQERPEDDEIFLEEEVHALIYEAIKDLSEQSRRIIILSMEGNTNPEIAKSLDISINTVKTTKLRAYKVLRERLKGIQWLLFLLLNT